MHACGHDAHIAAFIGTALALQKLKDQWAGTIIFVGPVGCLKAGSTIDSANRISRSDFMITRKCRLATSA
jgi:metal-dependent amidase/aminoacylase/carboxypeptidase family protein